MKISAAYCSNYGGRKVNEDCVYLCEQNDGVTAIVADGLGGMEHGDRASRIAVKTVASALSMEYVSSDRLNEAVQQANDAIFNDKKSGEMASTVAVLWINDKIACVSHVGDSRIYQIRDGRIIYQSKDHSVSQMAVMVGEITQSEIRGHKDRNRLVRALGAAQPAKPDTTTLDVMTGDAFLLCTDGFWELILEENIVSYLNSSESAAEWLDKMCRHIERFQTADCDNNTAAAIIVNGEKCK